MARLLDVIGRRAIKTKTFDGTSGNGLVSVPVPLFTVTGRVLILHLVPTCTTLLTESGGTATLALGVTGQVAAFIAATTATTIDVDEVWTATGPGATELGAKVLPAGLMNVAINKDIIGTIATGSIDAGVIEFVCRWAPLSDGATLVAA